MFLALHCNKCNIFSVYPYQASSYLQAKLYWDTEVLNRRQTSLQSFKGPRWSLQMFKFTRVRLTFQLSRPHHFRVIPVMSVNVVTHLKKALVLNDNILWGQVCFLNVDTSILQAEWFLDILIVEIAEWDNRFGSFQNSFSFFFWWGSRGGD